MLIVAVPFWAFVAALPVLLTARAVRITFRVVVSAACLFVRIGVAIASRGKRA